MKNSLKTQVYLAFHNRFFWASFLLMTAFAVFGALFMEILREQGFQMWRDFRFGENGQPLQTLFLPATSLYCKWLGGDAGQFTTAAFYFLVYLVCTVPFSWSLVSEKQSGYDAHMVLSAGKGPYYLSKYIASFLSGGFVVAVPLAVNFILSACFVPAFRPEPYADLYYGVGSPYLWGDLFVTAPLLYVALYILLAGIMAGWWATLGVSLALIVQNRFVVMICPYYRMYSDNDLRSFAPLADVNGALHPEMNERLGFMIYPGTESGPAHFCLVSGVEMSGAITGNYRNFPKYLQISITPVRKVIEIPVPDSLKDKA